MVSDARAEARELSRAVAAMETELAAAQEAVAGAQQERDNVEADFVKYLLRQTFLLILPPFCFTDAFG